MATKNASKVGKVVGRTKADKANLAKAVKGKGKQADRATNPGSAGKGIDEATIATLKVHLKAHGDELTPNQRRILEVLRDNGACTRKAMAEVTGMQKGYAKLLGAPTKGRKPGEWGVQRGQVTGLEPRGLVESEQVGQALVYTITAKGKALVGGKARKGK